jgi:hypothetical protein
MAVSKLQINLFLIKNIFLIIVSIIIEYFVDNKE